MSSKASVDMRSDNELDVRLAWFPEHGIAVTGATGFIGQIVSVALGDPHRVAATLARLADLPRDTIVIHLAAPVAGQDVIGTNFRIDRYVVEQAAASRLAGLIYASSNNVYGLGRDRDITVLEPITQPDGIGKRMGETLVQAMFPRAWALLRIGDVFGRGQKHGNLFRAIEQSLSTRTPLRLVGSGSKVRSYVYGPELALIILHYARLLKRDSGVRTIANICYPESLTVREIVQSISAKSRLAIERVPLEPDNSGNDVRTMIPGPFSGYQFKWTLGEAFSDYVERCSSIQHGSQFEVAGELI